MDSDLLVGLSASVFGGAMVSLVTWLANRDRNRAETLKLLAEAEHTRAETAALLTAHASPAAAGDRRASPFPAWIVRGSRPEDYDVALDRTVARTGSASARLEARPGARGFVTVMQTVRSTAMHGRRVRMSGWVRTEDVEHAALWMRVDGPDDEVLAFDNMDGRPITGTGDWREHTVVLDVPATSRFVAFGVLLGLRGRLWADDVAFDEVGDDVPTTDRVAGVPSLPTPENLGFED